MVKMKKLLAAILGMTMIMSLFAGCGSADSGESGENSSLKETEVSQTVPAEQEADSGKELPAEPVEVTYPVDSDATLSVYIEGYLDLSSAYTDFNEVPFMKGLEENTGIDIEWSSAPAGSDGAASYNLLLQEEELPDIIMGGVCEPLEMQKLIEDGIVRDISEYIPVYAPDYWRYINGDSEIQSRNRKLMTIDDKITYFIGARDVPNNNTWCGWMIRQDWLDELGLEMPETLEEFDTVARAFHDEYGSVITGELGFMNNCGFTASGTGAFAAFNMRYYVENDEVKLANVEEEWKEFLTIAKEWYDDGVLDVNFSGATADSVRKAALEGTSGLLVSASGYADNYVNDAEKMGTGAEWVGMPGLVTEKGEMCNFAHASYATWADQVGSYVTTDCSEEDLIAALQFLNYGYTEEGLMYWNYGTEGVSYELDENGEPYFTELIKNDPRGHVDQPRRDYTGVAAMATASLQMFDAVAAAYGENFERVTETWISNNAYMNYVLPPLTYTTEEETQYSDLHSAMDTYVSEMALKFVVGEESLDNFDGFVETLYSMGLTDLLEIQNAAYQRFMAE